MTGDAVSWYQHIAAAAEELRDEFVRMDKAGLTPKDFGLAVRSHPDSLIVTARNKMRTGQRVIRSISLEGKLVESSVILNEPEKLERNMGVLHRLVKRLDEQSSSEKSGDSYLWRGVQPADVRDFVSAFDVHPASLVTQREPLLKYIDWLYERGGAPDWDVVLVSVSERNQGIGRSGSVSNNTVTAQVRTVSTTPDGKGWEISGQKRRVASKGMEKIGLEPAIIEDAVDRFRESGDPAKTKNIPDWVYREARSAPLLMLHILDCRRTKDQQPFVTSVAAYGISFPGKKGVRSDMLVEYVVNTTWWRNNYGDDMDDDEMNGDE